MIIFIIIIFIYWLIAVLIRCESIRWNSCMWAAKWDFLKCWNEGSYNDIGVLLRFGGATIHLRLIDLPSLFGQRWFDLSVSALVKIAVRVLGSALKVHLEPVLDQVQDRNPIYIIPPKRGFKVVLRRWKCKKFKRSNMNETWTWFIYRFRGIWLRHDCCLHLRFQFHLHCLLAC